MRGEFRRLMERLEQLQPIITTVKAQELGEAPEQIRNNYEFIASVFYPMESVKRNLRDPMLRQLTNTSPCWVMSQASMATGKLQQWSGSGAS